MKKSRRLIALVLATGLVVVSLTGCSSSKGGDTIGLGSAAYNLEQVAFPLKEELTLNIMTQSSPLAPQDPNEKLIYKRLQEETNLKINWTNYTWDEFAEKRNLDIAAGEVPDAILQASMGDYDLLKYAAQGIIVPVEELIDSYMPNLKKVLDENPEYRKMMTAPDGHIYSFPWIEELGSDKGNIHTVDCMGWINKAWLDELGLEIPTTTDELHEVLKAFKENDPNKNGKQDEIPMSFIINHGGEDPAFLFGSFGLGDNWDHTVVSNEGEVTLTANQEGYKNAINYLNSLYKDGLIDQEAFEQDWNTYLAKGKDERYGLYFTWDKANISGPGEDYILLPPLKGPDGTQNVARTNGIGFDRGRMVITSANQNLELTAKWIDELYEPTQSVQNNWGTYGDDSQQNIFEYDEENNMLKHLPLEGAAPSELRQKTNVEGPLAVLDEYYGNVTTMPDDAAWRLEQMNTLVPYMYAENIYPKVFFSKEELDELSTIETDLFAYINRMRAEWIVNGKADKEWDTYLSELKRLKVDRWLEIKQEGYDRTSK
ncbi:MAG: ABC transporter substrate-binding protein [Peptostreptococcaceae bacterium]